MKILRKIDDVLFDKSRVCVCNPLAALHVRRTQKKEKQNKKEESLGVEKKGNEKTKYRKKRVASAATTCAQRPTCPLCFQ